MCDNSYNNIKEVICMATIKDVAKRAHVSVATVSRVINNKGYVNEETRQLVVEAIEALNYVPNELARSLFKKQSRIIGVIVPHMTSYYFAELIEIIENFIIEEDYHVMVCNSRDDFARESKYLKVLQQYSIDGILLVSNTHRIHDYQDLKVPIVAIDHHLSDHIPSVTSNNIQGGILAASKLIESGCTEIIHFRGPSILPTVQDRTTGFRSIMDKHRVAPNSFDLAFKDPDPQEILSCLEKLPNVNGIFCDSDVIALSVIQCLKQLGKNVPEDVQVIGFDNIELAQMITPRLTTISQNKEQIAQTAVSLLMKLIQKQPIEATHIEIDVNLIERETTQ